MKRLAILAFVACSLCAQGQAIRLEDRSPRARYDLQPAWAHDGPGLLGPERLNALIARAPAVEVRIDTSPVVGRRGRIYIALPQDVPGLRGPSGLRMEWRSRGLMQSGFVLPGERTLLYDGPVSSPVTSDFLDVTIHIDARHAAAGLRIEPYFEFEPSP